MHDPHTGKVTIRKTQVREKANELNLKYTQQQNSLIHVKC